MPQSDIVIVGATGTTGSALRAELRNRNVAARALVRSEAKGAQIRDSLLEPIVGDIGDPASLDGAFQGARALFVALSPSADALALNRNLFAAAKRQGVSHIVRISGLHPDPQSPSLLVRQHTALDEELRQSGIDFTILRPNTFYDNLLRHAAHIREYRVFHSPMGDAPQSMIDARDIGAVAAAALLEKGHANKAYDLTGPETLTNTIIAGIFTQVLGETVTFQPVPFAAARAGMIANGLPEADADAAIELFTLVSKGGEGEVYPDVERVLQRKAIRFEQFVRDNLAAFK